MLESKKFEKKDEEEDFLNIVTGADLQSRDNYEDMLKEIFTFDYNEEKPELETD